jgi:N-acetyl-anhydromuramyl-L-alanine amidase AmpD
MRAQRQLGLYGYAIAPTGHADQATTQALAAFQRHFRPAGVDGLLDSETAALIAAVAAICGDAP